MHRFKVLVFIACAWLLVSTLLGLTLAWGAYQTLGSAGPLKSALRESGIYQTGVGDALQQTNKETPEHKQGDIPIDRPEIQQAIKDAFPPQYIQAQSEKALDATYAWLQGETPTLSFKIDLSEAKTRLADNMAAYAQKRLDTLPACTAADLHASGSDVDVFTTPCVPPGVDKAALAAKAHDEIVGGDFLKDTTVSADTIKDDQGRPLGNSMQAGPAIYNTIQVGMYVTMGIAGALAAGVVLLSPAWQAGLRRLGIILLAVGGTGIVLSLLTDMGMRQATTAFLEKAQDNQALQEKIMKVVTLLVSDMRGHWVVFSVVLLAAGAAAMAVWYFTRQTAADTAQTLAHHMPPMKDETEPEQKPAPAANLPELKINYAKTPVKKKPDGS